MLKIFEKIEIQQIKKFRFFLSEKKLNNKNGNLFDMINFFNLYLLYKDSKNCTLLSIAGGIGVLFFAMFF